MTGAEIGVLIDHISWAVISIVFACYVIRNLFGS